MVLRRKFRKEKELRNKGTGVRSSQKKHASKRFVFDTASFFFCEKAIEYKDTGSLCVFFGNGSDSGKKGYDTKGIQEKK